MSGELTESQRELLDIVTGPDTPPDWWADHQKLALTARYMISGATVPHTADDVIYMLEKPWKHYGEYVAARRWDSAQ